MVESKESLLKQVDGLLDLSRRARRLAETLSQEDRQRLADYAEELEESALRLERNAVGAKTLAEKPHPKDVSQKS